MADFSLPELRGLVVFDALVEVEPPRRILRGLSFFVNRVLVDCLKWPFPVVESVGLNAGWHVVDPGQDPAGGLALHPRESLRRLLRALSDIQRKQCSEDVSFVWKNRQGFHSLLLRSLGAVVPLGDLQPTPIYLSTLDLTTLANGLRDVLETLRQQDLTLSRLVVEKGLLDDQHILTLCQLVRFLD